MVTDIHDVVTDGGDRSHTIFSAHSTAFQADGESTPSGCQVCSYDHGGHFGQTLPMAIVNVMVDRSCAAGGCCYLSGWFSLSTPPNLRPPIA